LRAPAASSGMPRGFSLPIEGGVFAPGLAWRVAPGASEVVVGGVRTTLAAALRAENQAGNFRREAIYPLVALAEASQARAVRRHVVPLPL
jgi:hypothetical protein